MINNYLATQIKTNFPFHPTVEQEISIEKLSEFILSPDDRAVFVLCGYAGTGKTTLVSALVRTLTALQRKCVLLAPTGRAAKVFASYSEKGAFTIHKWIYRQKSIVSNTFTLSENLSKNALFIVDEDSMIANGGMSGFGSGALLDDLVEFVYSGDGCRLLLLGDTAQLPPVGEELSPALSPDYLRSMYLNVMQMELTQVMRQSEDSGILSNATMLRRIIASGSTDALPNIRLKGFPDICIVTGENLIESIETEFGTVGIEETIILCRSNKRAIKYNLGVRSTVQFKEERLVRDDKLMIVKNCYHFVEDVKGMDYIANGDIARLEKISKYEERYGLHFAEARISFPDYDDQEIVAKVILDTLESESASLTYEQSNMLYQGVNEDYSHITTKKKRYEAVREDKYYNALQLKYANAITGHKSQGGQWKCVFIDNPFWQEELTVDDLKWLYTAMTRATEKVCLVNFKDELFTMLSCN